MNLKNFKVKCNAKLRRLWSLKKKISILLFVLGVGYLLFTGEFDFEKAKDKAQDIVQKALGQNFSKDEDVLYQNNKIIGKILDGDFKEFQDKYFFPHLYDSKDLKFDTVVEFRGVSCLPIFSDFGMAEGPMFTRTIDGVQTPALYNVQSIYCKKVGNTI